MKPTLVMLHGFTGSGAAFDHLRPGLEAFADVITPDHLDWGGHGSGGHGGPPLLLGYSMGGRYAMRAALARPDSFSALILESAHPGIESAVERAQRRDRDAELAAWIRRDYNGFLDAWNRLPLFASPEDAPSEPSEAFQRIQRTQDPETLARCLETFGAGDVEPVRDRLPELSMPVLAITGGLDHIYTDLWADIARGHPHIRHAVVPDAGHRVHLDRPEAYLSILTSFIQDVIPS